MQLRTVKKLDQKNRLHIPYEYLRLADIENDDFVFVTFDDEEGKITIGAAHLTPEAKKVFEGTADLKK